MTELAPADPALYGVSPDEGRPLLRGGRCRACELLFFPPQGLGCERCGARPDVLEPIDLEAAGTVVAATPSGNDRTYGGVMVVGLVELDAGPSIGVLFAPGVESGELAPGTPVRGVLLRQPGAQSVVELRFEP